MSSFNMFQDLPSIDFGLEDAPWTHVHNDRLHSSWSSAIVSYSPRHMNHFRMDSSDGFGRHMQTEASYYLPLDDGRALPRNGFGWQSVYKRDYEGYQLKYDGIAPWAPSVRTPGYVSPGSCVDERMASEQGSWSDGSTWSPGPSESHADIELEDSQTQHNYHAAYYSATKDPAQGVSNDCRSPRILENSRHQSMHSGSGITLQDVQQYPDVYQEDVLDNTPRFECKGFYRYTSVSGTPAEHSERKRGTATPHPTETIVTSLRGEEELAIKDELVSDAGNESGSDYCPTRRGKSGGARLLQRGKSSKAPTKRTNKISSKAKRRTTASGVSKRSTRAPDIKAGTSSTSENSPLAMCSHCKETLSSKAALSKHISTIHTRPFTCTFRLYGCPATFGSKNEWKRHVSSQHLRLGIWRCDLGSCLPSPPSQGEAEDPEPIHNDFNRKDLFTQHLRRMHAPPASCSQQEKDRFATSLEAACTRCLIDIRNPPPYSTCGYCPSGKQTAVFEGVGSWETRMEHVGRHLESGHGEDKQWVEDPVLRDWMMAEGLIEEVGGGGELRLVGLQIEEGKSKRVKK